MAKEIYYYLRTPQEIEFSPTGECTLIGRKPVVTVCLLEDGNERARGVAICSVKDNPCKRSGRKIAKDRAKYALNRAIHNCLIQTKGGEADVLHSVGCTPEFFGNLKAAYNPKINAIEMQIMGIAA